MGYRIEYAAFAVAHLIQRKQHFGAKFAAFLDHLVDQFARDFGLRRQVFEGCADVQQFMHHELDVAQGSGVLSHGVPFS